MPSSLHLLHGTCTRCQALAVLSKVPAGDDFLSASPTLYNAGDDLPVASFPLFRAEDAMLVAIYYKN